MASLLPTAADDFDQVMRVALGLSFDPLRAASAATDADSAREGEASSEPGEGEDPLQTLVRWFG